MLSTIKVGEQRDTQYIESKTKFDLFNFWVSDNKVLQDFNYHIKTLCSLGLKWSLFLDVGGKMCTLMMLL